MLLHGSTAKAGHICWYGKTFFLFCFSFLGCLVNEGLVLCLENPKIDICERFIDYTLDCINGHLYCFIIGDFFCLFYNQE